MAVKKAPIATTHAVRHAVEARELLRDWVRWANGLGGLPCKCHGRSKCLLCKSADAVAKADGRERHLR